MKKFSIEYKELVYESIEDKLKDKLSKNFDSLKSGVLELIEKSVKDTSQMIEIQNFIDKYLSDPESQVLVDFIEDNDIFNFYLKYQSDIDKIASENGYFDNVPKNNNISSAYDFVLKCAKFAVKEAMEIIKSEAFSSETKS